MMVQKKAAIFFGLFAQLQPVEEQIRSLQPDSEPVGDFLLFAPFLRADAGIGRQALRSLPPFQDQRPHQSGPHAVRSVPILTIDHVQLLERRFRAFAVMEVERALEPACVRLLHQRVNVAVLVIHTPARLAKDVGNVGGRSLVVGSQMPAQFSLEGAYLRLPDAFQALRPAQIEDESLFAVGLGHLGSKLW